MVQHGDANILTNSVLVEQHAPYIPKPAACRACTRQNLVEQSMMGSLGNACIAVPESGAANRICYQGLQIKYFLQHTLMLQTRCNTHQV